MNTKSIKILMLTFGSFVAAFLFSFVAFHFWDIINAHQQIELATFCVSICLCSNFNLIVSIWFVVEMEFQNIKKNKKLV